MTYKSWKFCLNYQVFWTSAIIILDQSIDTSFVMELIEYMIVGMYFGLIYMIFLIRKEAIVSNYNFIESKFIHWSNKRAMNPNAAYKKNTEALKSFIIPLAILLLSVVLGPLISAINDIGKLPLDHRAHFILFWPKVSRCPYYFFTSQNPQAQLDI